MRRRGLTILRVKVELIPGQGLAVSAIVDVEIKRVRLTRPLVRHRDARMFLKRHREKAVQRLVRPHRQRQRLIQVIVPQPQPEEIANRSLHARRSFSIPIHAQHQRLQMVRIVACNRDPNMTDHPRPIRVEQRKSLSGSNLRDVRIPPAAVITGNAMLHIILSLRQRCEPGGGILRKNGKCQKAEGN